MRDVTLTRHPLEIKEHSGFAASAVPAWLHPTCRQDGVATAAWSALSASGPASGQILVRGSAPVTLALDSKGHSWIVFRHGRHRACFPQRAGRGSPGLAFEGDVLRRAKEFTGQPKHCHIRPF